MFPDHSQGSCRAKISSTARESASQACRGVSAARRHSGAAQHRTPRRGESQHGSRRTHQEGTSEAGGYPPPDHPRRAQAPPPGARRQPQRFAAARGHADPPGRCIECRPEFYNERCTPHSGLLQPEDEDLCTAEEGEEAVQLCETSNRRTSSPLKWEKQVLRPSSIARTTPTACA